MPKLSPQPPAPLPPGAHAPPFRLADIDDEVSLERYPGRHLVLVFYPLAFTTTCTGELCTVRDYLAVYQNERRAQLRNVRLGHGGSFLQNRKFLWLRLGQVQLSFFEPQRFLLRKKPRRGPGLLLHALYRTCDAPAGGSL